MGFIFSRVLVNCYRNNMLLLSVRIVIIRYLTLAKIKKMKPISLISTWYHMWLLEIIESLFNKNFYMS